MLKRMKNAGLVPALLVTAVLAAAMIVPASANFFTSVGTPGCGYGYPVVGAPTVTNVNPNVGPAGGGTSVVITGTNFCNVTFVKFGGVTSSFVVNSRTKITATSPAGTAGTTVDVRVTNNVSTSAITPADQFTYVADRNVACSTQSYNLHGSDGATWLAMDGTNLSLGFTASADGFAVLTGNADLFTQKAGFNQDIGILVTGTGYPSFSGQPEAWKESGGFAGTFSPNAAFVKTVIPVTSGHSYAAELVWKTNKADPSGTISAGAGPIGGRYSQTCMTVALEDSSILSFAKSQQYYTLTNSNGSTWQDIDTTNLKINYVAPADGSIMIGGNADMWTQTTGFNQDLGVTVAGGTYPTSAGQPEAWKESGGFGGTFSPNAAFVNTVLSVTSGTSYTVKLQWKTNKSGNSIIHIAGGPVPAGTSRYSPTGLTIEFFPVGSEPISKVSKLLYHLSGSDGATWQAIDPFKLIASVTPTSDCSVVAGAGADLYTGKLGFNQDLGIGVSDGTFPSFANQPEGWKESGGFAGTFSPNAAYNQIVVNLTAGHTYNFFLLWKTNKNDPTGTIYAGAGPIPPGDPNGLSPTSLTLVPIGC